MQCDREYRIKARFHYRYTVGSAFSKHRLPFFSVVCFFHSLNRCHVLSLLVLIDSMQLLLVLQCLRSKLCQRLFVCSPLISEVVEDQKLFSIGILPTVIAHEHTEKNKLSGLRWCSGRTTHLSSLRCRVLSPVRVISMQTRTQSCEKYKEEYKSLLCRKLWVFSGYSGYLPQGILTGPGGSIAYN